MISQDINSPALVNPLRYDAYRALVDELVQAQKTTGEEQTAERIAFTRLNQQRMKRVEKQFSLLPELAESLRLHQPRWKWRVLVEAWCGDGAQLLPAIAAIAAEAPGIGLTVLLRDENPQLMDTCLTNGSRAIPILICEDAETGERVFTWGPRPRAIQEKVLQFKAENPGADHEAFLLQLHTWYAKDRSEALQQDLLAKMQSIFAVHTYEPEYCI
ncbi:thioredoxin family protein [Pontibacter russatus]|uniref:thioredoxin family protein n=1 Tax=Pontibacter russatus TaxID=2694929 RepID=UPI00137AF646|nr:thioredoxin family protein [Pontibacter russatus]